MENATPLTLPIIVLVLFLLTATIVGAFVLVSWVADWFLKGIAAIVAWHKRRNRHA